MSQAKFGSTGASQRFFLYRRGGRWHPFELRVGVSPVLADTEMHVRQAPEPYS
jgi:hypothetical protein